MVTIAEQAEQRLNQRYWALSNANKANGKVTVAVARELLGFVWAIATQMEKSQVSEVVKAEARTAA